MRAVVVREFGGPEQLRIIEVPDPVPGPARADARAGRGGPHLAAELAALRPGGQIASIATPELDLDPLLDANLTFHGVLLGDDGARTRRLAADLADGSLRAVVSHELPLPEAEQAHRILERGHSGGKIVLTVRG